MRILGVLLILLLPHFSWADPDKEIVRQIIQDHIKQVTTCTENRKHKSIINEGKIVVNFTFNDMGKVVRTSIDKKQTTIKNKRVQGCLMKSFKGWKFPPAGPGQTVTVSYPFVFLKN